MVPLEAALLSLAVDGAALSTLLNEDKYYASLILPGAALLGAALAALIVLLFGRGSTQTLILVGIGVSAIAGALTALALNLSPNPYAAYETMFWLMGSLANRSMLHVWIALPFVLLGAMMLLALGRGLDALSLGEDTAQSLGVHIARLSVLLILAVSMMVGATVAVAGAIGFVGLIVPHMLRPIIGATPSRLLLASGMGGAVLLLGADILVRQITPMGKDLQLGVMTALIGAPVFLHLVTRMAKR